VHVETEYDGDGRVKKTSLPFRPGQTAAYVETAYDVLNRPLTITQPGGAAVSFSYTGNTVTQTDEAGKQRRSTMNGARAIGESRRAESDAHDSGRNDVFLLRQRAA
jgi:YD repeat-containing protein